MNVLAVFLNNQGGLGIDGLVWLENPAETKIINIIESKRGYLNNIIGSCN